MNIVVTNGLNFFNPWWCNRLRHQKNLRAIAEKDPNKQTISFLWAREYISYLFKLYLFSAM